MYVTTFYSYKGGVGRTMALVNTAVLLAKEGKRVLVVDFDLEAPGLPSFEQFRCAGSRPGIVDYVCAYRDNGRSPSVEDFIVECGGADSAPIWLMPAGRYTQAGYGDKLHSIDWKDLYDNSSGFLMFEDLRFQWKQHEANFDYVLIDSRTGHTDVGGICTRQLPDAVVIMFLPNEQNIEGLKPIVQSIRDETNGPLKHEIVLHFCPSNVPDLDDEDSILQEKMQSAALGLGYDSPTVRLDHYNSMDLLTQPAFAASRPNAKLSRQYLRLMEAIIERNYADPIGARQALAKMPDRYEAARQSGDQDELRNIETAAQRIGALHPENGEIGWLLSILFSRMGAAEEEVEALTLSIEHDFQRNRGIIRRARALSALNQKERAAKDLRELLQAGTATAFDILPSIDLLRALDSEGWVGPVQSALEQMQASYDSFSTLSQNLMNDRDKLPLAVDLARRALDSDQRVGARALILNRYILCLIGLGRFELARDTIMMTAEDPPITAVSAAQAFNLAMADWGARGVPSVELFENALARIQERPLTPDANLYQCRAMAEVVVGRKEDAAISLDNARSLALTGVPAFSCWRYLEVGGRVMSMDIKAMIKLLGEPDAVFEPPFFNEVRRLVH